MNTLQKILIFFLVVFSSCVKKKDIAESVIVIDMNQNRIESIGASKLCQNMHFIPLDSNKEQLFGEVSKIIKTDKLYFILDTKSTKRIYAFNVDGTFFKTIGSNGKGPGEYLNPIDFVVDVDNEELIILDQFRKFIKIDYFGNLLFEKSLPQDAMFIEEISMYKGNLFASTARVKYNILQYQVLQFDKSFDIFTEFLPYETGIPFHLPFKNKFFQFSDNFYFIDIFKNEIYMLDDDLFVLKYNLNLAGKHNTFEQILNGNSEFLNSKSAAYLFDRCVAGDSIIFLPVFIEGRPHYGFLNIHSEDYFIIDNIEDDSFAFQMPNTFFDNKFISFRNSYHFNEAFPNNELQPQATDNPIIIEYTLASDIDNNL